MVRSASAKNAGAIRGQLVAGISQRCQSVPPERYASAHQPRRPKGVLNPMKSPSETASIGKIDVKRSLGIRAASSAKISSGAEDDRIDSSTPGSETMRLPLVSSSVNAVSEAAPIGRPRARHRVRHF